MTAPNTAGQDVAVRGKTVLFLGAEREFGLDICSSALRLGDTNIIILGRNIPDDTIKRLLDLPNRLPRALRSAISSQNHASSSQAAQSGPPVIVRNINLNKQAEVREALTDITNEINSKLDILIIDAVYKEQHHNVVLTDMGYYIVVKEFHWRFAVDSAVVIHMNENPDQHVRPRNTLARTEHPDFATMSDVFFIGLAGKHPGMRCFTVHLGRSMLDGTYTVSYSRP